MSAHRGQRFTHQRFLQPGWKPGPGEKYKDGPKAEMVVTHTIPSTVFYGYADGHERPGGFRMSRTEFESTYPEEQR